MSLEPAITRGICCDADECVEVARSRSGSIKKLGIIEGTGTNKFNPDAQATRAEAVTVLLKVLAYKSQ
ncbi:S-layer homology domain-containing protein [Paenibacillus sp. IHBB 10380]|uniref:S-layer homology domain-containing protein n=1 Tax=Paenibacillus sp. IHBB 10380 TaxID=1566358 RepID=UPI0005CFD366|nr:S-layer homology domain-containing protein [Paenibacillus sp. IHBB 10380]AJS57219.1 hypothetical protein UB51_00445 [Paenibacillus sp. IHBB 10380]